MGKFLIITGIILLVVGVLIQVSGKIPFLDKLPGDIHIERGHFKFCFPLTSSILLSILISIILLIISRSRQ